MDYRKQGSHAQGVYPHTKYLRHKKSKSEARGRSGHQRNSKTKLEERNVGTKKKSLKQGLIGSEDLTIMVPEGRDESD